MAWASLVTSMKYEDAKRIADSSDLFCLSCSLSDGTVHNIPIKPIVTRKKIREVWYNYFDDNTYRTTFVSTINGDEPSSYSPFVYVPDKIRYLDLLRYIKDNLYNLIGIYNSYLLYISEQKEEFVYSLARGVVHSSINIPFDNPMLYFETGRSLKYTNVDKEWLANHGYNIENIID